MTHTPLQLRRDTSANWTSNNPTLGQGEIGLQVDGSGNLTGAKVGNGTDNWAALPYQLGTQQTGYGYYEDTAAAQAFTASTRTQMTNNKGTVIETQLPADITTFWASDKVTGVDGEDRVVRVQFTATPSDATCTEVFIEIDIGGGPADVDRKRVDLVGGSGVAQDVSESFELFCGSTFETNGASVFLTFDGPVSVTNKTILVKRSHKAR